MRKFSIIKLLNKFYTKYEIFDEPHFHYSSNILNISDHCFLRGYWQSESYFQEYINEIKKIFKFNLILKDKNLKIINDISNCKSVSLHIRRGDFLLKKNKNHLVDLNEYYSISIKEFLKILTIPNFLYLVMILLGFLKTLKLNQITKLLILMKAKLIHRHVFNELM